MSFIIVSRLPSGELAIVEAEPGTAIAAEFINETVAQIAAEETMICLAHGYDIVEIDA